MKASFNIIILFLLTPFIFAETKMVAKVELVGGEVKARLQDGQIITLKKDQEIAEGAIIKTFENSFVKISFSDQSSTTLGANSIFKITAFTKTEPGILYLLRGKLRSQVSKDYMNMENKNQSKLFIRTKTAAMGVRGTDFQVNFDQKTENTSLLTFEGSVVMNKIDESLRDRALNQKSLEYLLERKERIQVDAGRFSFVNKDLRDRPLKIHEMDKTIEKEIKENKVPMDKNHEAVEKIIQKETFERLKEPNPEKPSLKEVMQDLSKIEKNSDQTQRKDVDFRFPSDPNRDLIRKEMKQNLKEELRDDLRKDRRMKRREDGPIMKEPIREEAPTKTGTIDPVRQ